MTRPFEGIRILDATHVLAGPFAAYQLALLGAEVIKVEHPGDPDQSRGQGPDWELNRAGMGTYFLTQGSNKRSLTLDLKSPAGREILHRLVATADAVTNNARGDQPAKLGIDYAALGAIRPAIVCVHASAYGRHNERAA